MTKVLKFELSKRLNYLWLLDNIETEYWYKKDLWEMKVFTLNKYHKDFQELCIKTLTLEEAIEFLIKQKITFIDIIMPITNRHYHTINSIRYFNNWKLWEIFTRGDEDWYTDVEIYWKTFIEAIEKMLEYLIDNNLLTK